MFFKIVIKILIIIIPTISFCQIQDYKLLTKTEFLKSYDYTNLSSDIKSKINSSNYSIILFDKSKNRKYNDYEYRLFINDDKTLKQILIEDCIEFTASGNTICLLLSENEKISEENQKLYIEKIGLLRNHFRIVPTISFGKYNHLAYGVFFYLSDPFNRRFVTDEERKWGDIGLFLHSKLTNEIARNKTRPLSSWETINPDRGYGSWTAKLHRELFSLSLGIIIQPIRYNDYIHIYTGIGYSRSKLLADITENNLDNTQNKYVINYTPRDKNGLIYEAGLIFRFNRFDLISGFYYYDITAMPINFSLGLMFHFSKY